MPLTDRSVQALKPSARVYRRADGRGLSIQINPSGTKQWRFRYRFNGIEKMLSLGSYPGVSLADARIERDRLRRLLAKGKDPSHERRLERFERRQATADTLATVIAEFIAKRQDEGAAWRTIKKHQTLAAPLIAELGSFPIRELKSSQLLATLKQIEARGRVTMANEARALMSRVYKYAVAQGRADIDIAAPLASALRTPVVKGRAGITDPSRLGQLLCDIQGYAGDPLVRDCLLLLAHLFVRPGELLEARWSEFDLEAATWRIPAQRTKLRRDHIAPLSPQALEILLRMKDARPDTALVAESNIKPGKPFSDMAFNKALRSLGYTGDVHVAHGFRSTASTLLN